MRKVKYGSSYIEYSFQENERLKSHYVTVERGKSVVLKGKAVSTQESDQLILRKARWILNKLRLVSVMDKQKFVTGSRIMYMGRSYYLEVVKSEEHVAVVVEFNYSKFRILVPDDNYEQMSILSAVELFYHQKAVEKITPRIRKLSKILNLPYESLKFRKLEKSWGNCSPKNVITISPEAMKLPFSLIDYLLIHELCHTKVKDHSKQFWAELSIHVPNWRDLDERIGLVKY